MDVPSGNAGNQVPAKIAPAKPPVEKLVGDRSACSWAPAPLAPSAAEARVMMTLRYHLLWDAHQPGTTDSAVRSGKSISRAPAAAGDFKTRPPSPKSIPCAPRAVNDPSMRN